MNPRVGGRRAIAALVAWPTLWLTTTTVPAGAHDSGAAANPTDGAELACDVVDRATVTFDDPVTQPQLEIADENGARLPTETTSADTEVEITFPPLPAGAYELRWFAIADDGHPTRGSAAFVAVCTDDGIDPVTAGLAAGSVALAGIGGAAAWRRREGVSDRAPHSSAEGSAPQR